MQMSPMKAMEEQRGNRGPQSVSEVHGPEQK
jgi:hypothetical protein